MTDFVLDMPYQTSVHGIPRRRRNPDVWFVRRTVPVGVRRIASRDAPEARLVHLSLGRTVETPCRVVDGRLHLETGYDVETWRTDLVLRASVGREFRPVPNPTPIRELSEKFSAHSSSRTVAEDFSIVLSSDEDEARAAAVLAGSRLVVVDGAVLTSNVEPVFGTKRGWSRSGVHLVPVSAPPSLLATMFGEIAPLPVAGHGGQGVFGTASWTPTIDPAMFAKASILARCIEGIFPASGAGTAMLGDGRPGSSSIPDALEDAVWDLRKAMRRLDGPDGRAYAEGPGVAEAIGRFVEEVRRAGPSHVRPERGPELRSLIAAAETSAVPSHAAGDPRP